MGEVRIKITAKNVMNGNSLDLNCLVDTGARMFVLPAESIAFLELESIGQTLVEYADGRQETLYIYGPVRLYYDVGGNQVRVAHVDVIEGKHGVDPLLGQVPLEVLDLLVDCPNQRISVNPDSPATPKYNLKGCVLDTVAMQAKSEKLQDGCCESQGGKLWNIEQNAKQPCD